MMNKVKITQKQIQAIYDFLSGMSADERTQKEVKILYSLYTPKDIYIKYTSFELLPDNSISSLSILNCIMPDGTENDCDAKFKTLSERLEFESQMIEMDIDANCNLVLK